MARLNHVNRACVDQGPCSKCGNPIKAGESYVWWANRIGRSSLKRKVCGGCRTKIRRSEYATTSDKLARIMDAEDDGGTAIDAATCTEDLVAALREASETIREVGEGYRESADNMPENLQQSSTYDEITEKSDNLESWADTLESAADDIENAEFDPEEDESEEEFLDGQRQVARDAMNENPL